MARREGLAGDFLQAQPEITPVAYAPLLHPIRLPTHPMLFAVQYVHAALPCSAAWLMKETRMTEALSARRRGVVNDQYLYHRCGVGQDSLLIKQWGTPHPTPLAVHTATHHTSHTVRPCSVHFTHTRYTHFHTIHYTPSVLQAAPLNLLPHLTGRWPDTHSILHTPPPPQATLIFRGGSDHTHTHAHARSVGSRFDSDGNDSDSSN